MVGIRTNNRLRVGVITSALLLFLAQGSQHVLAHGGGVDAQGCHSDKKTNQRHCHQVAERNPPAQTKPKIAPVAPAPAEPRAAISDQADSVALDIAQIAALTKQQRVVLIQQELSRLGYYQGLAQGRVTLETFNAIRAAQSAMGLAANGQASGEFLVALKQWKAPNK